MSRMIGNDARVGQYFITPELGTTEEACPLIHNSRDFITGVDPIGNYIIRDDTQSKDRISINKTTGVITFDPPLPTTAPTPSYTDYALPGLTTGNEYILANLDATGTDYQGVGYFQLTCTTSGLKHEAYFCATAMYRTDSASAQGDIYLFQNLTQSATPPFIELELRAVSGTPEIEILVNVGQNCDATLRVMDATQGWVAPGSVVVGSAGSGIQVIDITSTQDSETGQAIIAPLMKAEQVITNVVAPKSGLTITSNYAWQYGGSVLSGVGTPVAGTDVANKAYVDALPTPTTPGMVLDSLNTVAPASAMISGDVMTTGVPGEVGKWKLVVPDMRISASVGLTFFMTRPGGAQLAGEQNGCDWSAGGFIAQSPVVFPGTPIFITEVGDSVSAGTFAQLEIDVIQNAGNQGTATINFTYYNSAGRFRRTTRHFQTNPATDMAGFYIRPTGGSTVGGTVFTYKYSSL